MASLQPPVAKSVKLLFDAQPTLVVQTKICVGNVYRFYKKPA